VKRRGSAAAGAAMAVMSLGVAPADTLAGDLEDVGSATTTRAFERAAIFFAPDSTSSFAAAGYGIEDDGRVATTTVLFPPLAGPHRVMARVAVHPLPQDERTVWDPWDRAGNVRLAISGLPDLEVVRFVTPYGGTAAYEVDVSHLAPLLRGEQLLRAFIDTWLHPAWEVDVSFRAVADTTYTTPSWVHPVLYEHEFSREKLPKGALVAVHVPPGLARVVMEFLSTGHCTDGRDEDEFVSKANVISVDGVVVERFHPWRDDCRENRAINPYCRRWADGSWSSDLSRSGWCPGREVPPVEIDLTDHLRAGRHEIGFLIEDMRPRDASGHFGYWRVSAYLVGWDRPPRLWRNP